MGVASVIKSWALQEVERGVVDAGMGFRRQLARAALLLRTVGWVRLVVQLAREGC
jgi:hypothetical protein